MQSGKIMKPAIDNFSSLADLYAKFRPIYPDTIYRFLQERVSATDAAWDCGTGNGQVAAELAKFFRHVTATDISRRQLDAAPRHNNITYLECRAEHTPFVDDSFDLITVGQAIHWFDFDSFYPEVRRVARNGALFAAWAYTTCHIDPETDLILDHFYKNIVGPYWDKERQLVDDRYQTIPFPLEETETPEFHISTRWTLSQFEGYLSSWSAVDHYRRAKGEDPLELIAGPLRDAWQADVEKEVVFPVFMRAGFIRK
jgi:ubiquinone/menaquinone biosynthesis C-methylase UbiE